MTIMPYVALTVGSFILSVIVAYFVWRKFTSLRYRMDLLTIRAQLLNKAKTYGCLKDLEYLHMRGVLNTLISDPDIFDWSTVISLLVNDIGNALTMPSTQHPEMKKVLAQAKQETAARILGHLLYEATTGIFILILLYFLPSSQRGSVKNMAKGPIVKYIDETDSYHSGSYAGMSC